MAYDFDGTNDRLHNVNGLTGIDVDARSVCLTVIIDAGVDESLLYISTGTGAGTANLFLASRVPGAGGDFALRLNQRFSTTIGRWTTGDYNFGDVLRVAFSYDRSSTANDPRIAINGTLLTVGSGLTESATPVGTAATGDDSLLIGETPTAVADLDGKAQEYAVWSSILLDDQLLALSNGYTPDHFPNEIEHYWPLINLQDKIKGADLVIGNGDPVVIAHQAVIQRRKRTYGVPSVAGAIAGTANLSLSATGTLGGLGGLSGAAAMSLASTGALGGKGELAGAAPIALTATGLMQGQGALAGLAEISLAASGNLQQQGQIWTTQSQASTSWSNQAESSDTWSVQAESSDTWTEQ